MTTAKTNIKTKAKTAKAPAAAGKLHLKYVRSVICTPVKHKLVVKGLGFTTRGHKGQRSRSGSRMMRGFEGGQMPLHRRVPKRGFTNIFREEYNIVNLEKLANLGESTINPDVLRKAGVISTKRKVKILGDGELKSAITVHAHKFSKSAQEKITKAGGKFEVLQ
jgi:large subunit ribosomal protein L15